MGRNGQGLPPAGLLRGTWGGEALGSVPGEKAPGLCCVAAGVCCWRGRVVVGGEREETPASRGRSSGWARCSREAVQHDRLSLSEDQEKLRWGWGRPSQRLASSGAWQRANLKAEVAMQASWQVQAPECRVPGPWREAFSSPSRVALWPPAPSSPGPALALKAVWFLHVCLSALKACLRPASFLILRIWGRGRVTLIHSSANT